MKSDIEKIYLIDRFLKGELSGPALDEFKNRLRTDKQFAEEVESQRAIIEGIKMARREHLISILNGQKVVEMPIIKENSVEDTYSISKTKKEISIPEDKNLTGEKKLSKEYRLRPNYNNWYYAAVAVLFAGFAFYAIFGYYIPHQKLELAIKDSTQNKMPEDENIITAPKDEEPELAVNPNKRDTTKVGNEENPAIAQGGVSLKVEKDKKVSETMYSVAAFETNSKIGGEKDDGKVSTKDTNSMKLGAIKKVRGSTLKVEYWQSVVNFKGYKLNGGNLQLFEVKPDESVSLKYLDKQLYLKRNGNYYKLNASGNFEQFQKESNTEIIKNLETN